MILYLHGFRSSPSSFKARRMQEYMQRIGRAAEFFCPALSPSPALAIAQAEQILDGTDPADVTIIGSSLGGYYATWLAEKYGCKAMLVNPAVKPPRELESYVGVTTYYHSDEVFEFKAEYVDELRALAVANITQPERYFLLAATGDEVLDWREMVTFYQGAQQLIIQGSDHGLAEFADMFDQLMAFCDGKQAHA
ncbi:alpha/beta fold hydrolase [Undibacterium jejuense]|uniref:Alpha/beta fold hydrolase n=1 Tax=Undibacterium jejuense TaxID=1344949 RepID=A0A923HAW8_9BURK|nr:YqiA/YcfP family alpha/beta fold hydrolase [Undibacterium jejuense]MBC3861067.1 alpha/beta fold hydrolase [Undibacterium jejuense]